MNKAASGVNVYCITAKSSASEFCGPSCMVVWQNNTGGQEYETELAF